MNKTCENCGTPIAPTASECNVCGHQFIHQPLVTQQDFVGETQKNIRDMAPPDPNALPENLRQFEIIRRLVIATILIFLGVTVFNYDRDKQLLQWMNNCVAKFHDRVHWTVAPDLPLSGEIQLLLVPRGNQFLYKKSNELIDLLPIQGNIKEKLLSREELYSKKTLSEHRSKSSETLIIIEGYNSIMFSNLKLLVWLPFDNGKNNDIPMHFEYQGRSRQPLFEFLLGEAAVLFLLLWVSNKIKQSKIENFRKKQRTEFDNYQETRTESIFELKKILEESRQLAEEGKIASALIAVNSILRDKPNFKEAIELKKMLLLTENAGTASLFVQGGKLLRSAQLENSNTVLYLRILGTPYAYQAPPNLDLLTVGRQRRKKGHSREEGNDVVIRVPGSENKSLRISRRHLEIQRINDEYFVIDKSNGHTTLNGKKLTDTPVRIHSSDKLFIAGVFILEVVIRAPIKAKKIENIIRFNSEKIKGNLSIEATLGDMLTEFPD